MYLFPPQAPVTGIPEYPITLKHKPPVGLDKVMPNPGRTHLELPEPYDSHRIRACRSPTCSLSLAALSYR